MNIEHNKFLIAFNVNSRVRRITLIFDAMPLNSVFSSVKDCSIYSDFVKYNFHFSKISNCLLLFSQRTYERNALKKKSISLFVTGFKLISVSNFITEKETKSFFLFNVCLRWEMWGSINRIQLQTRPFLTHGSRMQMSSMLTFRNWTNVKIRMKKKKQN